MDGVYNLDFLCLCSGQGGVGGGLDRYPLYSNHLREERWYQVPIVVFFVLMHDNFSGVSFCSWNVNGVNNQIKRGKVLSHLKSLQADIMFLQETHLSNDTHGKLRCKSVGQIYHSKFLTKTRGTAILIRKGVTFKHLSTIADKNGRYVMVTGELHSVHLRLLNIYGPNYDDSEFF